MRMLRGVIAAVRELFRSGRRRHRKVRKVTVSTKVGPVKQESHEASLRSADKVAQTRSSAQTSDDTGPPVDFAALREGTSQREATTEASESHQEFAQVPANGTDVTAHAEAEAPAENSTKPGDDSPLQRDIPVSTPVPYRPHVAHGRGSHSQPNVQKDNHERGTPIIPSQPAALDDAASIAADRPYQEATRDTHVADEIRSEEAPHEDVPASLGDPPHDSSDTDPGQGTDAIEIDGPARPPSANVFRPPPTYRPPAGAPSYRPSRVSSDGGKEDGPILGRARAAAIELRVLFDRGGNCRVTLLPKRAQGQPDAVTTRYLGLTIELTAVEDEYFQDIDLSNLSGALRAGLALTDLDSGHEWVLSGREIFILAPGTTQRGFISTPRLSIGREHVVLVTAARVSDVREALQEAGCADWTELTEHDGVPIDWVLMRGVVPKLAVTQREQADILNALRPLHDVEIELERGIRLEYSTWLKHHPPTIRIYGDLASTDSVLIDGGIATRSPDGGYQVSGWDDIGLHQVWCKNTSVTYTIVTREPRGEIWQAHSFRVPLDGENNGITVCGPLVRGWDDDSGGASTLVMVPSTNRMLIGAEPGQVCEARPLSEVRDAMYVAVPSFNPVWALPARPLLCKKLDSKILLLRDTPPSRQQMLTLGRHSATARWWGLILDAGRKGLRVHPPTQVTTALWREYRRVARDLWRKTR